MARPKNEIETAPLGFRLPVPLIDRIDRFAVRAQEQLEAQGLGGRVFSRSDAIRVLLDKALTAEGFRDEKPSKRK